MGISYKRVKELALRKGINSDNALCNLCEIKSGTFNDWKSGRTESLTEPNIIKLANGLEVPVGYLVGEEDEIFFSERESREICNKIVQAFADNPELGRSFIIPSEIKKEIWNGTYVFSNVSFPQFRSIVGDINEQKNTTLDDESGISELLEELRTRPEMRMLFSVSKDASKEDIERAVNIIEALRKTEGR